MMEKETIDLWLNSEAAPTDFLLAAVNNYNPILAIIFIFLSTLFLTISFFDYSLVEAYIHLILLFRFALFAYLLALFH